jgi:photosystem II stability/assembly factor-like uncharacterized protein
VNSAGLRVIVVFLAYACRLAAGCNASESISPANNQISWTHAIQPSWSILAYYKKINAINFSWDNHAYLAMDDGILSVSDNRGGSFHQLKVPIDGNVTRISSNNAGTIFLANTKGYAISYDFGSSWTPYNLTPSTTIQNFSTPNNHPGITWLELVTSYRPGGDRTGKVILLRYSRDRVTPDEQVLDQEFDLIRSTGDTTGWGIKGPGIFRTDDGGAHWRAAATLPLEPGEVVYQAQQFNDELTIGTSTGRLFELTQTLNQLPSIPSDRVYSVAFTGGASAMAITTNNILLFTKDFRAGKWEQRVSETSISAAVGWEGERFLILTQNGQVRSVEPNAPLETIVIDAITGDVQAAAVDDLGHAILSTDRGELLSSIDSGRNWKIAFRIRGSLGSIALGSDGHGVAVANGTDIRQTLDGGQTWHPLRVDLPGPVISVAVRDREHGIAQVRRGDAWRSDYLLYAIENDKWTPLPSKNGFSFLRWGGSGHLFGINYRGSIRVSSDNGREWTELSSDISDAFAKLAKDKDETPEVVDAEFLDEKNGWVIGSEWVFHTENGGKSWSRVEDPQFLNSSFKAIHFFDADHGFVYDATGSQWFYNTNDGGKTWNYYDPFSFINTVKTMAFSRVGTGIFIGNKGVQVLEKLENGPDLRGVAVGAGLDSLRLTLMRKDRPLHLSDLKAAPNLMVRVKGKSDWDKISLPNSLFAETAKGLEVSWRPSQQDFRVDPGQVISQKVEIADQDGFVTDVSFDDLEYQPLLQRYRTQIIWGSATIIVLITSIGLLIGLYKLYPIFLIRMLAKQDAFLETFKAVRLEALIPVLQTLFFHNLLQNICLSKRVQHAWVTGYLAGREKVESLPEALLQEMIKTDQFIDAWVSRRLVGVRAHLYAQLTNIGCAKYIPLPVTLRSDNSSEDLREPSAVSLRRALLEDQHSIGIVAGGGRGKTTLAGQIGLWFMDAKPEDQMIPNRPVLVVLIVGEIMDVLASIRIALQAGYRDDDAMGYDKAVLEEALRRRRLVLVADGLSELSKGSVDRLSDFVQTVPVSILIYTARRSFRELSTRAIEISPQEIEKNWVSRFIAEYVFINQLQSVITARDQLLLSEKIIDLIDRRHGHDTLPALFLRILVQTFESADETQRLAWRNDAPLSLAETAQRFVRELRPPVDLATIDSDVLAQGATNLARLSLDRLFVVRPFSAAAAKSALMGLAQPEMVLRALEECTVIQREVVSTGTQYRFYLDPIAEYLAAASWMIECGDDLSAWAKHIDTIRQSMESGHVVYGYTDALADCIVAQPFGRGAPEGMRAWALRTDRAELQLTLPATAELLVTR